MAVFKQLEKDFSHLSDMIGILRSQAFTLSKTISNLNDEALAEAQLNMLSNQLMDVNRYVKDIKRWLNEIRDETKS